MYKDLVVPITGMPGDLDALSIAIDLATSQGAHLTVLQIVNLPMPVIGPWGMAPDVAIVELYKDLRSFAQTNVSKLRSRLAKLPISAEVELIETLADPARSAVHCAHHADLSIVAGSIGNTIEAETTHAYFGSLLLESGRPVLVVPPGCGASMPPKRVVVAWRATREAARALHDALPLLMAAEAVDLLIIDADAPEDMGGSDLQPGADVAGHLARHGVKANVVVLESRHTSVGSVVLDHAREMQADLLVVGGYGHARFREWALGGVTRELLVGATIPVFYSH